MSACRNGGAAEFDIKPQYSQSFEVDSNPLLAAKGGKTLYAHFQTNDSFEPDLKKIVEAIGVELPPDFEFYPAYANRNRSAF